MKKIKLKTIPFNTELILIIEVDRKLLKMEHYDGGIWYYVDENRVEIALKKNPKLSVIIHECKHVVNKVFMINGYVLDNDNDEFECYYLQYIFKQVINKIPKDTIQWYK